MSRLSCCMKRSPRVELSTIKMKLSIRQRCLEFIRVLLSPTLWFDVYWPASRKYWFSLLLIGVICAKLLHIYSHLNSLSPSQFILWGPTFFLQDVVCIIIAHPLSQNFQRRWLRVVSAPIVILARYEEPFVDRQRCWSSCWQNTNLCSTPF